MEHIVDPILKAAVPRRHATATRGAVTALACAAAIVVALAADPGLAAPRAATSVAAAQEARPIDVQQWGGAVTGVAAAGDVAYAAIGPRLVVVDVADVAAPRIIGQSAPIEDVLTHLFVDGDRVYGLGRTKGLAVFDVAEAAAPRLTGVVAALGQSTDLDVVGDRAYVCDDKGGLRVIDLAAPTGPAVIGIWTPPDGAATTAAGSGDIVFVGVASSPAALVVLDVGGMPPRVVARVELPGRAPSDIALASQSAFIALDPGLVAVDIGNPAAPAIKADVLTDGVDFYPLNVLAVDGEVLWASSTSTVYALDVRDPTAIPVRTMFEVEDDLYPSLVVDGPRVYFADSGGLRIVDIGDPLLDPVIAIGAPDEAGEEQEGDWPRTTGSPRTLALHGGYVLSASGTSGLRILDGTAPMTATEVGQLPMVAGGASNLGTVAVVVSGDRAFAAEDALGGGLRVIDIGDPRRPRELGSIAAPGKADRPAVAGDLVAVPTSGDGSGVRLYRVAADGTPRALGALAFKCGCAVAALDGTRLFLGGDDGLFVVDIADVMAPVLVGSTPEIIAWGGIVVTAQNRLVVADPNFGLYEVDVSDLAAPTIAARYPMAGRAWDVALSGDTLWVANGDYGITRLTLTPGGRLVSTGHWFVGQAVFSAAPGPNAVWMLAIDGLVALDPNAPSMPRIVGELTSPGILIRAAVEAGRIAAVSGFHVDRRDLHVLADTTPLQPLGRAALGAYRGNDSPGDGLALAEGVAWVPSGGFGVIGFDTGDPAAIRRLTAYRSDDDASVVLQHVVVDRARAIGLSDDALIILDVSVREAPSVLGRIRIRSGEPRALAVGRNTAWVLATGDPVAYLYAFQISSPAAIVEVGRWPLPADATDLSVDPSGARDRLVVAGGEAGLLVWDIEPPAAAHQMTALPFVGPIERVAIADGIAWTVEQGNLYRVSAVDLDADGGPVVLASTTLADWLEADIAAEGRTAVVANGHAGLYALHMAARDPSAATPTPPAVPTPTTAPPIRPAALYLPLAYAGRPSAHAAHAVLALDRSAAMALPASADATARRFDVARALVQAAADGAFTVAGRVSVVAYDAQAERLPLAASAVIAAALAGLTLDGPSARHDVALAAMRADVARDADGCRTAVLITAGRSAGAADAVALDRSAALRAGGVRTFVVRVGADDRADARWLAALAGDGRRLVAVSTVADAAAVGAALAASMDDCP